MLMEQISLTGLQSLMKELHPISNFVKKYTEINEKYKIGINFVQRKRIVEWAKTINKREEKHYRKQFEQTGKVNYNTCWAFGEWKVFGWTAISTAIVYNKDISLLSDEEIQSIAQLFKTKSFDFIKFQFFGLLRNPLQPSRQWEPEELKLLVKILQGYRQKEYNWRDITFELFIQSDYRYYRGVNKCKEKWLNHLNPHLVKASWSAEEDLRLFKLVRNLGTRWALISQKMNHIRTQHMVKNRYTWYVKTWREHQDDDEIDVVEKVYSYLKEKTKDIEYKKQEVDDREIYPFLNQGMEGKFEYNFCKEEDALPSSKNSANMQPQPLIKSQQIEPEPQHLIKCQQVKPEQIKNEQVYYPFFPFYDYIPAPDWANVDPKIQNEFN